MEDPPISVLSVHKQNSSLYLKDQHFIMYYHCKNIMRTYVTILFAGKVAWIWNGPLPDENDDDYAQVEVPETRNPLSEDNFHELVRSIDPLSASENYGADIYLSVVSFISESAASSNWDLSLLIVAKSLAQ